ncbi:MAG TPA: ABC transporter permease [Terracidiphilus sp.]|nr:ABC transporter permease [Terracidiphilus sp.]
MAAMRRVWNLFRRNRVNDEIDAEIEAHIGMRIDENVAHGMTPEEARRDALLRFGNPTATKERVTAADATLGLDRAWFDVRYAWRQLMKSPGFTITAAATIALGIGANTAIFSSMDAVVLRPLAVPALDRVVVIAEQDQNGLRQVALANYEDWQRMSHSFEEMAVRTEASSMSLTGAGEAANVETTQTSAEFFPVLRTQALLGRVYGESECKQGRDAVAVLSYGFWRRQFASDPHVLGRQIVLAERAYTVIGVLPRTAQYPSYVDVFLPLAPTPQELADRTGRRYVATARLRDGVTVKQAQAEMRITGERLAAMYPAANQGMSVRVEPLLENVNGDLTPLYYKMVMGATLFVLLVVCANVANLQFARGIGRRPEIAMRTALGASRMRLMRQLLTENLLLGLIGGAGGVALAAVYLHLTLTTMPARVARYVAGWSNISLNGRGLLFSLVLAVGAGVVSGFMPALEALRVNLAGQLKAGSRSSIGSGHSRRLRSFFAGAQIAFAVALVIGAALMAKGMEAMLHLADAYEPGKVLTFSVDLPDTRYDTPQKQAAWYAASVDRLRALPGVTQAAVTTSLPYSDDTWMTDFEIENRPYVPGKFQSAQRIAVSDGYFAAMRIPILSGRKFTASDTADSVPVAVVSRGFVNRYFPGTDPLGHRIRLRRPEVRTPWLTIVGVAQETSYSLWDESRPAVVYMSTAQLPLSAATYVVRTAGDPLALAEPARKALDTLDPSLPIDSEMTMAHRLNDNLVGLEYVAAMLGIDAGIALLLAAIGIFGVMATLVGEQTREIGVRLALGARREDVLRMILQRAGWLTAAGLGAGLVLAFALAHGVANLLRGVRSDDPAVFTGIAVMIAAIALGSSWIPARRAARVDPMQALRSE